MYSSGRVKLMLILLYSQYSIEQYTGILCALAMIRRYITLRINIIEVNSHIIIVSFV